MDWWVVAAAGDEQLTALEPAVERFPSANSLWSSPPEASYSVRRLQSALTEAGIPIIVTQTGQAVDLEQGAWLDFLAVTPKDAVLLLEWGNFRALLPVGLDFDALDALLKDRRQTPDTALLLTGSGFAPLNPPEWIERWRPQVFLTDQNGWIELSTDGEQMWVGVEKE